MATIKQDQVIANLDGLKFYGISTEMLLYGLYKCTNVKVLATLLILLLNKDSQQGSLVHIISFYMRWYRQTGSLGATDAKLQQFWHVLFGLCQRTYVKDFYLQFLAELNAKDQTNLIKFTNHFTDKFKPYLHYFINDNEQVDLTKFDFNLIDTQSLVTLALEFNQTSILAALKDHKDYSKQVKAMLMDPLYQCYSACWQRSIQLDDFDNYRYRCKNVFDYSYLIAALVYCKRKDLVLFAGHFGLNTINAISQLNSTFAPIDNSKYVNTDIALYNASDFDRFVLNNSKLLKKCKPTRLSLLYRILYMHKIGKPININDRSVDKNSSKNEKDNEFLVEIDDLNAPSGSDSYGSNSSSSESDDSFNHHKGYTRTNCPSGSE